MAAGAEPARSMLIRDERIAAVGSAERVRAAARPGALVVPLEGAAVIPGLIDAHCHLCDVGYLASGADCSQPAAPDIPAIIWRLRAAAAGTPEGSWVTGSGYVEYKLREGRHPTRADLDAAVPGRPAILFHTSLHACVLNTPALREAGLDDRQPDPPGGRFGRDREGRLDGLVYEGPTFTLLWSGLRRDMERMSAAQRAGLVARAARHFAARGVTAACDADTRRASLTAYAEADEQGVLGVRIAGLVVHDEADWLLGSGLRGRRSSRLAAESVKIWADGGIPWTGPQQFIAGRSELAWTPRVKGDATHARDRAVTPRRMSTAMVSGPARPRPTPLTPSLVTSGHIPSRRSVTVRTRYGRRR